jgi:hypothetical protein
LQPGRISVKSVLEDKTVKKLTWDCRNDYCSMLHQYRVRMAGVVDLQLNEVAYRLDQGDYMKALGGLGWTLENTSRAGLTFSQKSRMTRIKAEAKALFAPERGGSYEGWKVRPLDPILIEYATDAHTFFALRRYYSAAEEKYRSELERAVERRLVEASSVRYGINRDQCRQVDSTLKGEINAKRSAGMGGYGRGAGGYGSGRGRYYDDDYY